MTGGSEGVEIAKGNDVGGPFLGHVRMIERFYADTDERILRFNVQAAPQKLFHGLVGRVAGAECPRAHAPSWGVAELRPSHPPYPRRGSKRDEKPFADLLGAKQSVYDSQ